jgi:hypothetical protein
MTIEDHFKIFQKEAAKKLNDSIEVYNDLADKMSDVSEIKRVQGVSIIVLNDDLKSVFADLYSKSQPKHIQDHYQNVNIESLIKPLTDIFQDETDAYLKSQSKFI